MPSEAASAVKNFSKRLSPASLLASFIAPPSSTETSPSASACPSSGRTSGHPTSPMVSATGRMSDATIPSLRAIASISVPPRPSQRDGNDKTSAAHMRSGTSVRCPSSRTAGVHLASACTTASALPARPATRSTAPGIRAHTRRKASIVVSTPFCRSSRPTLSTSGAFTSSERAALVRNRLSGVGTPSLAGSRPR